jgi:hypothetical protein
MASRPTRPRVGAHGLPVAHKIGWLDNADNDVAARRRDYSNGIEDASVETFGEIAVSNLLAADHLG